MQNSWLDWNAPDARALHDARAHGQNLTRQLPRAPHHSSSFSKSRTRLGNLTSPSRSCWNLPRLIRRLSARRGQYRPPLRWTVPPSPHHRPSPCFELRFPADNVDDIMIPQKQCAEKMFSRARTTRIGSLLHSPRWEAAAATLS